jgi:hypothetical protein
VFGENSPSVNELSDNSLTAIAWEWMDTFTQENVVDLRGVGRVTQHSQRRWGRGTPRSYQKRITAWLSFHWSLFVRYSVPGICSPPQRQSGRGYVVDRPPPSCAEVKGKVELYLCAPSEPFWSVLGQPLPLPFVCNKPEVRFVHSSSHVTHCRK